MLMPESEIQKCPRCGSLYTSECNHDGFCVYLKMKDEEAKKRWAAFKVEHPKLFPQDRKKRSLDQYL